MSVPIKGGRAATDDDDHTGDIFIEGESVSLTWRSFDVRADRTIVESEESVCAPGDGCFVCHTRFGEGLTGTASVNGGL